ncbi:MAG: tyrosine-type recombinase/integrase [Syntrophales bacterium]|jgi:integrase
MPNIKITKSAVDKIQFTQSGQVDYWDTELKGFGINVGTKTKTYFVLRRVKGQRIRVKIDRYNVISPTEARDRAKKLLIKMADGINPNSEKSKERERGITLSKAYDDYVNIRKPKRHTMRVDRSLLKCHLSKWIDKPITEITKDMVGARHRELREKVGDHTANNVFRLFRRIYNCANASVDDTLPINPVKRLSDTRQWAKVGRRLTIIKDSDLPEWFEAVQAIENPFMRYYLLLLLFTGLRKNEALSLRWDNVDLQDKTFTILETKNGKPHTLPMSDFIYYMFRKLKAIRYNEYVFPALTKQSKSGHMAEPKRQVDAIVKSTGITFCLHDLRRVFKTTAQDTVTKAESDRLTNHTSGDAGDGYIILSTEKLRKPMERVNNKILLLAEQEAT